MVHNQQMEISIARDLTRIPGPRYEWQGKNSGEFFLREFLRPSFIKAEQSLETLQIDLDGTEGYSSAFLDESFGGLAREFGVDRVLKTIKFITFDEPFLEQEIIRYMKSGK